MAEENSNIAIDKAEDFALRILNFCEYVIDKCPKNRICEILVKQLARSGTSIGANLSESYFAQSDADFFTKVKIAQKEAKETEYWLRLIYKKKYVTKPEYDSINKDCQALIAILTTTTKTLSRKIAKK